MLKGLKELSRHDVVRDAVESFPDNFMLNKYLFSALSTYYYALFQNVHHLDHCAIQLEVLF